jgi:hypothetical protein
MAPEMDSLVVSSTKVENPEVLAPDPKTLVSLLYTVPFSSVYHNIGGQKIAPSPSLAITGRAHHGAREKSSSQYMDKGSA